MMDHHRNRVPVAMASDHQIKILSAIMIFVSCVYNVDALFGGKKKKLEEERALAAAVEAEEADLASELVNVYGLEISKTNLVYGIAAISEIMALFVLLSIISGSSSSGNKSSTKGNRPGANGTIDVVLVGCGLPKKGMGWYHLTQLLEMSNINVKAVVEPFFLNPFLCSNIPPSFTEFVSSTSQLGVQFAASVDELDTFTKPTLCLIAGRTADNPKLFRQCAEKGASCIYLEKPGAPSVAELVEMKNIADIMGVKVYIGYNKNVTPYVKKALAYADTVKNSQVAFVHNNSYKVDELSECFSRNAEGMLKNMAVHELALLVTFFGVTVDNIKEFKVLKDPNLSQKLTLGGFTDFSRVSFEVTTKSGTTVGVMANRCGGNVSNAAVLDNKGEELKKFEFPDAETEKKVDALSKADPDMMPYFFVQSDDYLELKKRVVNACINGNHAEGVATITVAIEALKLAEYGTEKLNKELP